MEALRQYIEISKDIEFTENSWNTAKENIGHKPPQKKFWQGKAKRHARRLKDLHVKALELIRENDLFSKNLEDSLKEYHREQMELCL